MNRNLSFDILATDDMSAEEFARAKEEFFEKYPECPVDPSVECLDLLTKREEAEKILSGEKKIVFVDFNDFYCDKLYDQQTHDFVDKLLADHDDGTLAYGVFYSPIKHVYTIHFHNYSNTWYLDVLLKVNDIMTISDDDIEFLHKEFNCYELDGELKECNKKKIPLDERPQKFYFVIDEVLDTNLSEECADTANKEGQAPQGNEKRLSFDILSTDDMTDEEFDRAEAEFFEKYPECPRQQHLDCLDIVINRDQAEKILSGEKKVHIEYHNEYFSEKLFDPDAVDFMHKMEDEGNEEAMGAWEVFYNPQKLVDTILFHNYTRSWYIEVSVKVNGSFRLTDENVDDLHEEFDCHDQDRDLELCKKLNIPEDDRPRRFFFVFDKVLDTNYK